MAAKYASQLPAGTSNTIRNIALVGAGGRSGRSFASALLATNRFSLTALTRVGSTSTIDPRIRSVPVDYDSPASLTAALRGHDALIITLNARTVKTEQPKLISAATAAGIPWILPNEFGFDPHDTALGDEAFIEPAKRAARAQIERGGSSWLALINGFWYEYSLACGPNAFGFDFANKTVTFVGDGSERQNTTTIPQMGEAVARLFSLKVLPDDEADEGPALARWRNGFVFVSSFVLSQREMLESVLRVTGDKREEWTVRSEGAKERYEAAVADLKMGKMEAFQRAIYTRVMYPGCGEFGKRNELANEVLGLEKLDLDQWTAKAVEMAKQGTF